MRCALPQIGLHSFSKVGTAIDTGQDIVEIDGLFCCMQTPLRLLHRPDGERSKSTDLLRDLGDLCHEDHFIDHCSKKAALQGVGRCEQARGKKHLLRPHRAERVYQVPVIVEGDAIAQRSSYRYTKAGGGSGVPEIAYRCDDQASADGISVYGCN